MAEDTDQYTSDCDQDNARSNNNNNNLSVNRPIPSGI